MFTLILWLLNNRAIISSQKSFHADTKDEAKELLDIELKKDKMLRADYYDDQTIIIQTIVLTKKLHIENELKPDDASYLLACHAHLLSKMQTNVAVYLRDKLSNKEIAEQLCINVETVKFHVGRIFKKLGVQSRHFIVKKLEDKARSIMGDNAGAP